MPNKEMTTEQLEAWAKRLLRRWPERRAAELAREGKLAALTKASRELFGPFGQIGEQDLADVEGGPFLPPGPLRELNAVYETYCKYLRQMNVAKSKK